MPRVRFPDPLTLLMACIFMAALLSYLLPAGEYERRDDPATGRSVVVSGTYHRVDANPVNPFDAVVAIPRGLADAAAVVFLVFLVGGAFTVVDKTGALGVAVGWLASRLARREAWVIPVSCLFFAMGGVLENMQEEIIPLIPVLLVLTRRIGFDAITAVAMSVGAAMVGSAFSPINPFQVGIAQKLADVELLSGGVYRSVFLTVALAIWIAWTMRHALRTRGEPTTHGTVVPERGRAGVILLIVVTTFGVLVVGMVRWGWDFEQMSALFFIMGVVAGLIGGLGVAGTAGAFVDGFRGMAYAAMLIGFARAIFVVLDQGRIVDTVVHGLFTPIANLPTVLSAFGMMVGHTAIHIPVPSVSGHAVLTMPILVPLADLLGLSRQVTVLAYHYGAGLCDLMTPTNGALMAVLASAGLRYDQWFRYALPIYLVLFVLGMVSVALGVAIGLH
jgi:uncharacterized ion transporter superfamily protein YfcC